MNEAVNLVHTDEDFHTEIQLVPIHGLIHLRTTLPILVFGRAGNCDQGSIDHRSLLRCYAVGLEVGLNVHLLKDLLPEIVQLQQVAESEDRDLVRDPLADQVGACKPTHRRHLNQRILHRRVAEVVSLLHQVNPQQGWGYCGRSPLEPVLG